jgi:hypothetical protein
MFGSGLQNGGPMYFQGQSSRPEWLVTKDLKLLEQIAGRPYNSCAAPFAGQNRPCFQYLTERLDSPVGSTPLGVTLMA